MSMVSLAHSCSYLVKLPYKKITKIRSNYMSKVYNDFNFIANNFRNFISSSCPSLSKPCLNIMPEVLTAMTSSLSSNTSKIALSCKGSKFDFIQSDSVNRRIRRFFNNLNYNPYDIFDSIIKHIISKFSCKHSDNRVHIVFDHMYKSEDFVTLMFTLRLGKKSIPLWFRSFDGGHSNKEALKESLIMEGIKYVSDLFSNKNYNLIFLADRWFNSASLLNYIDSLGHTYIVRAKAGHKVKYFDKKENNFIWKDISHLFHYVHKATYYEDVSYTRAKLKTNIVFSATKSVSIKEHTKGGSVEQPWILLTNGDVKRAVKDYHYRFGAIEFLFKDQKSNGFDLQKSNTSRRSLQSYSMMYTCMCICILFLTCVGTYYTRHKNSLYKGVKIRYYSTVKGKHFRKMSIFRVGHTLFNLARDSLRYIKIPFNFVLTDV